MHSRLTLVLAAIAPCLLAAGPAKPPKSMGDVVTAHKGDPCSASRMVVYKHPQKGLPAAVQKMRLAIIDACVRCKPLELEKLGLPGRKHFDFSFSHDKRPGPFWLQREKTGHKPLAKMVTTLHLAYAHDGHVFIWPAAYGKDPQDKDWDALREIYSERDIILFQKYGGFNGMRIAIADDGDWIYAIEGE